MNMDYMASMESMDSYSYPDEIDPGDYGYSKHDRMNERNITEAELEIETANLARRHTECLEKQRLEDGIVANARTYIMDATTTSDLGMECGRRRPENVAGTGSMIIEALGIIGGINSRYDIALEENELPIVYIQAYRFGMAHNHIGVLKLLETQNFFRCQSRDCLNGHWNLTILKDALKSGNREAIAAIAAFTERLACDGCIGFSGQRAALVDSTLSEFLIQSLLSVNPDPFMPLYPAR